MEEKKATGIKRYIPNTLSIIRIIGTLLLPLLMWEAWEVIIIIPVFDMTFTRVPIVWIIVFLALVCTDKLDGTLARKFRAESSLGAILDTVGDALILVMGATLCFAYFVKDNLKTWQLLLYIGIVIICVFNEALIGRIAKKYHNDSSMIHSYSSKFFAVCAYLSISIWAFLRTIPIWSILFLLAADIYALIDRVVFIIRTDKYDVNFKGHGFQKYKKRKNIKEK